MNSQFNSLNSVEMLKIDKYIFKIYETQTCPLNLSIEYWYTTFTYY